MTETIFLALILSVIPLCKYPIKYGNGFNLKETLFFLVGIAYAIKVLLFGGMYATSLPGQFLFCTMLLAVVSMMWCTNVEQGWQDVPKWIALYILFVLVSSVPVKTAMLLSVAFLPLYLAYGLCQVWMKEDPLDKSLGVGRFVSVGGNTNHTAAFLAPYAFICLWLTVNVSLWFIPLVVATIVGVYYTKCYASWVGLAIGACFVCPPHSLLGLVVVGAVVAFVLMLRKWNKECYAEWFQSNTGYDKEKSITARMYYIIVAYHMWRKRPFLGWGLRSFRKEIYDIQAQLDGKYASLVTQYGEYNAYPQRTHNDLAESFIEMGAVGFLLLLGFFASVLYGAITSGNYILMAGVICLIANGMLFYTLSSFSYIPWMVLAACASGSAVSPISLPLPVGLILSAFLFQCGLAYVIKPHLVTMWLARANKRDDLEWQNWCVDKALELCPTDGPTLSAAIKVKAKADMFIAQHYAERAVHHYDGAMRAWGTWGVYGELLWKTGNWEGAKRALRYTLFLNPTLESPKTMLGIMEAKEKEVLEAQKAKQQRMEQFNRLANGRAA